MRRRSLSSGWRSWVLVLFLGVIVPGVACAPKKRLAILAPVGGEAVVGSTVEVAYAVPSGTGAVHVHFRLDDGAERIDSAPIDGAFALTGVAPGLHRLDGWLARADHTKIAGSDAAPVHFWVAANASDPAVVGQWAPPVPIPTVAVDMVVLHTGKVLFWAGEFASAPNFGELWDPTTNAITHVPNPFANIFCSGHVALADGRILVAGGHDGANGILGLAKASLFDPVSESWTALPSMAFRRWYPTLTALPDGRAIVNSGSSLSETVYVDTPEVYDPVANTWTRLDGSRLSVALYPLMFLLPDGRLLQAGSAEHATQTRALDFGSGQWSTVDARVLDGGTAAMFLPGQILKTGSSSDGTTPTAASSAETWLLDLTKPLPAWRSIAPMAFARSFHNLTLLPDGSALAIGGSGRKSEIDLAHAVFPAERWSPATERWSTLAAMQTPRLYHGSAVLLPDARVAVAGGGNIPGGTDMLSVEVFSPPYLFRGPRPVVTSAPAQIRHGTTFAVDTPDADAIAKVSLVRPGAATHAFDQDQRFLPLAFSASGASRLEVTAPIDANLAPPGYYMLFLVDRAGVPSLARFVRIPAGYEDSVPPTAPSSLTASGAPGAVSLTWTAATDDGGGAVSYRIHRTSAPDAAPDEGNLVAVASATSHVDTGVAPGTHYYVVVAMDAAGNPSPPSPQASALVPADGAAPTVSITAPTAGAMLQGVVPLAAIASDASGVASVQFRVDGAPIGQDATAPFSVAWNTLAAENGPHVLTAVARDPAGNEGASAPVAVAVANSVVPGLVASWSFEEGAGATTADASGNGHSGTIAGATWSTEGRSGGALFFDGVDDRVTVADANGLDLTTGMTLQAWVRPTANGGWRTALLKERSGDLAYALYAEAPAGRPEGYAWLGSSQRVDGSGPLPLGVWTHLALTYDGSVLRLYRDGVEIGARAVAGTIATSGEPLRIGGNAIWGEHFGGWIDEVRVYDRALAPAEVVATMNQSGGAPRLVVTAPLDGATVAGGTVDVAYTIVGTSSAVDHVHFRVDGGPELHDPPPIDGSYTLSGLGGGVHALTGFLVRADHSPIAGSDAAITTFEIPVTADTTPPAVALTAPREGDLLQGTVTVTAAATDAGGVAGVQFRIGDVAIGAEDTTSPYSVSLDTLGVPNGAQILRAIARDAAGNMSSSLPVGVLVANPLQRAGLVAAYGFEEGAGPTVLDSSGNGNTGTLSGATRTSAGRSGSALSFDGVNDRVDVAHAASLDLDDGMTLAAWVRPTQAGGWRTVLLKEQGSDLAYALYANTAAGRPEAWIGSTSVAGAGALPLDVWSHLAVTWDGATMRLYRDGAAVATRAFAGAIAPSDGALRIGGNAIWSEWFRGQLDEVRVYDRALTPAEIAADRDTPVVRAAPTRSSPIVVDAAARRVWVVNPDNDSVTAIDADTLAVELEIPVCRHPVGLALDGVGQLWVACRDDDRLRVLSAATGATIATLTLPWGSAPVAVVFAPDGADGFVAAQGRGRVHRVQAATRALGASLAIGSTPRALAVTADGSRLLVTQLLSSGAAGRVRSVDLPAFTAGPVLELPLDATSQDGSLAARGLPNYLASIAIEPLGREAWVAAKKDNVLRGLARDGLPLTFETTVRALAAVLDLGSGQESLARRVDFDNLSQPSAVVVSDLGAHVLATLQGNDVVVALNAHGREVVRADVGRAPQGLAVDPQTRRVFTHDFMSRTVTVLDGAELLTTGAAQLPRVGQVATVSVEALPPAVLRGKQLFYAASDTRMARDGYLSCAACHLDGEHDGQVWDFTDRGEGLRNTISLRGQGGAAGGPLHWTGNFDEVQDFEGDLRTHFLGSGLMADADWSVGTRAQPLGLPKAGLSADLDALAAYVDSLVETPRSPARQSDGTRTAGAVAGQVLFAGLGCTSCHSGPRGSDSPTGARHDVGTLKPGSGSRLGGPLDGLDTPMLPGLATSGPWLHDGSAATVRDVLTTANPGGAHGALGGLTPAQVDQLVEYLLQLELGTGAPP